MSSNSTEATPVTMSNLPPEIIQNIFRHIHPRHVLKFCQLSKSFQEVLASSYFHSLSLKTLLLQSPQQVQCTSTTKPDALDTLFLTNLSPHFQTLYTQWTLSSLSALIWSNAFTHPAMIPPSLSTCSMLHFLCLDKNNLHGSIPDSLGTLRNLYFLDVHENNLTGGFPASLCGVLSLQRLYLDANQLSGPLPREIGKLVNLQFLSVSRNRFSGEIPREVGGCVSLRNVDLSGNLFEGEVPWEAFAGLMKLDHLNLGGNQGLVGRVDVHVFRELSFLGVKGTSVCVEDGGKANCKVDV
ncbi:L domain-like protein [Rhizoclosmatium globosum]|uniref:L domain-like protein n=1 Tax=Rhizoclosmatium globosum TaxID=329046 RepID=A0A1Y2BFL0_9FUNG|nr:L domain-like protein [Rhizoclosmatium globosum]|eukprot:ORY33611.1 L domain-like protein [Rhizoclosmatium globosum]